MNSLLSLSLLLLAEHCHFILSLLLRIVILRCHFIFRAILAMLWVPGQTSALGPLRQPLIGIKSKWSIILNIYVTVKVCNRAFHGMPENF